MPDSAVAGQLRRVVADVVTIAERGDGMSRVPISRLMSLLEAECCSLPGETCLVFDVRRVQYAAKRDVLHSAFRIDRRRDDDLSAHDGSSDRNRPVRSDDNLCSRAGPDDRAFPVVDRLSAWRRQVACGGEGWSSSEGSQHDCEGGRPDRQHALSLVVVTNAKHAEDNLGSGHRGGLRPHGMAGGSVVPVRSRRSPKGRDLSAACNAVSETWLDAIEACPDHVGEVMRYASVNLGWRREGDLDRFLCRLQGARGMSPDQTMRLGAWPGGHDRFVIDAHQAEFRDDMVPLELGHKGVIGCDRDRHRSNEKLFAEHGEYDLDVPILQDAIRQSVDVWVIRGIERRHGHGSRMGAHPRCGSDLHLRLEPTMNGSNQFFIDPSALTRTQDSRGERAMRVSRHGPNCLTSSLC